MVSTLERLGEAGAVLIAGPTASGKSRLAMQLAKVLAGRRREAAIVNADSMQVYRELRLITARPTAAEEAHVPHRLYGTVAAGERYSIGRWLDDVGSVLAELRSRGAVPIVVGGTGLYLRALTEGLAAVPPVPAAIRTAWAEALASEGAERLHAMLRQRDPKAALTIRPSDPQRIVRALEVLDATGRSLRAWQSENAPPLIPPEEAERIVLEVDNSVLADRISRRFDAMVAAGALDEAAALLRLDLAPELPAMKAIGVRELAAVLRDEIPVEEAMTRAKAETRRYAKRQRTWFRNQMPDWRRMAV